MRHVMADGRLGHAEIAAGSTKARRASRRLEHGKLVQQPSTGPVYHEYCSCLHEETVPLRSGGLLGQSLLAGNTWPGDSKMGHELRGHPMNIVLIMADQLTPMALPFHGHPLVKAPN